MQSLENNIVVVTDTNVRRRVWPQLRRAHRRLRELPEPIVVAAGEQHKNMRSLTKLHREFLDRGLDRSSVVVALGGGMLTDLAGFAASTWMRGIAWIAAPTTLLGMVDASIGGKVAVNLGTTKNIVGAFHQPDAVLIGTRTLETLPARERRAGLAEVAKYAMIADAAFFRSLELAGARLLQSHATRDAAVVGRCARLKARVVEADEKESGKRDMLNFGHTIGHVLETGSRFELSHGEAVGLGMLVACRLAELRGIAGETPRQRLTDLLRQWRLPVQLSTRLSWSRVWSALQRDKKSLHGTPRFVLTPRIGHVRVGQEVPVESIREALQVILPGSRVR